jgi:hypothetical protein
MLYHSIVIPKTVLPSRHEYELNWIGIMDLVHEVDCDRIEPMPHLILGIVTKVNPIRRKDAIDVEKD